MPAIVFDFEEINKNILGDDWWKQGKREPDKAAVEPNRCVPIEKMPMPCTQAPTPPAAPCGQVFTQRQVMPEEQQQQPRNQMERRPFALPADAPSQMVAIRNLLDMLNRQLAQEAAQVELHMAQIKQTKMHPRRIEKNLQEVWDRYLISVAPMRQQCEWLVKQLALLTPWPMIVGSTDLEIKEGDFEPTKAIVCAQEYECEVHEATPQSATHLRMSLAEQEKRYQILQKLNGK
jgi:hypothetical protein